jgi:hypothetical protein
MLNQGLIIGASPPTASLNFSLFISSITFSAVFDVFFRPN